MAQLTRTRSGEFSLADSHTLSEIEALVKAGDGDALLRPIDTVFLRYPKAVASRSCQKLLENGNSIPFFALQPENGNNSGSAVPKEPGAEDTAARGYAEKSDAEDASIRDLAKKPGAEELVRLYDADGRFAGIYRRQETQAELKPVKIFWEKD